MGIESTVDTHYSVEKIDKPVVENQGSKISGKTSFIENPALFLIENFSQAISKIYKEMGVGNYIDYDV